jgi:hypothetical protein
MLMALHLTPAEHDADPPSGWTVHRRGARKWELRSVTGAVLALRDTKREAESLKAAGFLIDLYDAEGRWFRGESVPGWKPYKAAPTATPTA